MKKYLENPICELKPLFKIDYRKKVNIISCCFFKMYGGGYKTFQSYTDGIVKLYEYVSINMPEFRIRLFIDNTIYEDERIMTVLNKLDIDMVLYECGAYIIEKKYHMGLFGTLLRFFPLFNFQNNDAAYVFSTDIDFKHNKSDAYRLEKQYQMFKIISNNRVLNKNTVFFFDGNNKAERYEDEMYKKYPTTYVTATKFGCGRYKMSPDILINFILKTEKTTDILSYYQDDPKFKLNTKFVFGIDEYFINRVLFKTLVDKKIPYLIKVKYQLNYGLYMRSDKGMLGKKHIKEYLRFFKFIFEDTNYKYNNYKQYLFTLDKLTYFEYKNLKDFDEELLVKLFFRMYKYFIMTYHANKIHKLFGGNFFMDIVLDDLMLGKAFFSGLLPVNIDNPIITFKEFVLPDDNITELKKLKIQYKVPKNLMRLK